MKTKKSSVHDVQSRPSEPGRIKIGDLMVREGLLSPDGLERALQHQKKSDNYKPLGKVCVELKLISRQELQRFLRKHHQTMHLGDVLLNMGLISQKQLQHVLEQQHISSNRFGTLLVQSGIITESQLVEALSIQLDLPRIMPAPELVDPALLKGLDEMFFREHVFLPIQKQGRQVAVVMADPLDGELLQKLVNHYECRIIPSIATATDIMAAISTLFDAPNTRQNNLKMEKDLIALTHQTHLNKEKITPIAQFLLRSAVQEGATSLHIESQERYLRVRFRIDGILRHKTDLPQRLGPALVECLKTPFRVKRDKYWEEKIQVTIAGKQVELSISFFQGQWGESVVIYVLYPSDRLLSLDALGLSPVLFQRLNRFLESAGGILLSVSPIRQGKSTILYALLNHLNHLSRSILTLETVIEHSIPGVLQQHYTPDNPHPFSEMILAMGEYDSDILMVNQLPDLESISRINQISLLGKKILSSLQGGDTTAALFSLLSLKAEALLNSPVPLSFLAQKLVRRLCERCKSAYTPSEEELSTLGIRASDRGAFPFYQPVGCEDCMHQGYKGLGALHEWLDFTQPVRETLQQGQGRISASSLRKTARERHHLLSMAEDGIYKAIQGQTSLSEVRRVVMVHEGDAQNPRSLQDIHAVAQGKRSELF
ncbi:MAG: Flp pilus assembly complex ATPase component TadA [Candidatus Sericytochromatia bacterium]|nr:Flp pilus assembly complex ATPase component TadA [Candidatus Sericytochromatia bacterium]